MAIETLKSLLPDYAKDIRINLSNLPTAQTAMTEQQLWGTLLAAALAGRNARVIAEVATEAATHLSPEALAAAKAAAAIMAMNNVYYRSMHQIADAELAKMPARLRMQVIGNPGVDRVDFELWCLAVSAVNGCEACLNSHLAEVTGKGLDRAAAQDAIRVAAVIHAVSAVLDGEAALTSA